MDKDGRQAWHMVFSPVRAFVVVGGEYRNGAVCPTMKNRLLVHLVHIIVFKGFYE
ncbi:hypothetical protein [Pseudomonas sp. CM27]|uniref:hypothetical protein n=1 Tax=Pseudomonas sp. CM27 TaxID=2738452 RepID=UPI001554FDEF|nr:hypothetical protein [Pseudomonas sp. CM27]NQD74043.1 hypothetical protein [Pseudomonas sp. CM27]